MKTTYCTREHPYNLITQKEQPVVTEELFREELQRLIDLSVAQGDNPVHQAQDQLRMADSPTSQQDLLQSMMQEEAIYSLMMEVENLPLMEAPKEMEEEYNRRTLNSFLIEVMKDQNR